MICSGLDQQLDYTYVYAYWLHNKPECKIQLTYWTQLANFLALVC